MDGLLSTHHRHSESIDEDSNNPKHDILQVEGQEWMFFYPIIIMLQNSESIGLTAIEPPQRSVSGWTIIIIVFSPT